MSRDLELTALLEHVLRYLASNGFADPPDGPRLKAGATVRSICAASHGRYDPRQVTQCVRSLAKVTTGSADHLPRVDARDRRRPPVHQRLRRRRRDPDAAQRRGRRASPHQHAKGLRVSTHHAISPASNDAR